MRRSVASILRVLFYCQLPFIGVFVLLGFSACLDMEHKGNRNDIPTKGELEIAIDINDSLMFNQLIARFHEMYPKAHIKPMYLSPMAILEGVRDKKINALYINYLFDTSLVQSLESRQIKVRSHIVGSSATAFVVNQSNPNDRLSADSLYGMMSGQIKNWARMSNQPLIWVLVKGDLTYNYLNDWYQRRSANNAKGAIPPKFVQVAHPQALFQYVNKTPGAMGFVGMNWIADRGDTLSRHLRHAVKVIAVQNDSTQEFHLPYQSQVYAKQYPFITPVMGYDLQGYSGLAQGFLAFCCDQGGQILLKKCGLSPAIPPTRTIQLFN
jgi:phosphate transport system substrate-binding protein